MLSSLACKRVFGLLALIILYIPCSNWNAQARYIIDDRNSTIQYGLNTGAAATEYDCKVWSTGSDSRHINVAECFANTITYNMCFAQCGCYLAISFTGSGISLYGVLYDDLNINITINTDPPTLRSSSGTSSTFIAPIYNYTLYHITGLTWGNYTATIALLDSDSDSDLLVATASSLYFDYAVIDDTGGPAQSATTQIQSPSHHSRKPAEMIAGLTVAIGALIVIGCLSFLVRHRRIRKAISLQSDASTSSIKVSAGTHTAVVVDSATISVPAHRTSFHINTLVDSSHSTVLPTASHIHNPLRSASGLPITPGELTEEELQFVRGLSSQQVPMVEILQVVRVMRERIEDGYSESDHAVSESGILPPYAAAY